MLTFDSDHPHPQSAGCHICSNCLATGLKVSALRFGFATKNDTSTSTRPPTPCARGGLWGDSPVKDGDGDGCASTKAPSGTSQELSQELFQELQCLTGTSWRYAMLQENGGNTPPTHPPTTQLNHQPLGDKRFMGGFPCKRGGW